MTLRQSMQVSQQGKHRAVKGRSDASSQGAARLLKGQEGRAQAQEGSPRRFLGQEP